jgi:hypothetical protein
MRKSLALFIAMLMLALWTTGLSMKPVHPDLAEGALAETHASPHDSGQPELEPTEPPEQKYDAPEETPSDAPPPPVEEPALTEKPEETQVDSPAQEEPGASDTAEPTLAPPESITEAPTAIPTLTPAQETDAPSDVPSQSPTLAPSETPSDMPSQSPTLTPSETPAAPEDAPAGVYQVSPSEAVYTVGSLTPLMFSITPPDAAFTGVEGVECAYADGVVTIGPDALAALSVGDHILAFLFDGGARVDVPLKVVAAKVAAKGDLDSLTIGGTTYYYEFLSEDRNEFAPYWTWDASKATLTLDGYDGKKIYAQGSKELTVVMAPGSVNTVTSSDDSSLTPTVG